MIIGIDLDEVLVSFSELFLEMFNKKYNTTWTFEDMVDYDFETVCGRKREDMINIIYQIYESNLHQRMKPVKGAKEAIQKLKEQNHKLYVITSRQKDFEKQTKEWIELNFPNSFEDVILTNYASKQGKEIQKSEICEKLNIDIFIDDQKKYCETCLSPNRKVFLLSYPWNVGEISSEIIRVSNWNEILQKVNSF